MQTAGRYIAEERGAFDVSASGPSIEEPKQELATRAATAPLVETVILHMNGEALMKFYRWYGDLD